MARRRSSRTTKIQPAVERMIFTPRNPIAVASAGPGIVPGRATYYIDLSQCASLVNRRFYRQGIQWAVSSIRLSTTAVDENGVEYVQSQKGKVTVSKLPSTWILSNSWEKSFRSWQRMIKNATDESGMQSVKGKFLDFKIFMDEDHHTAGFSDNLVPQDLLGNKATVGQWQPSEFEIPDIGGSTTVTSYDIIGVGRNYPGPGASGKDAVSIVQGYADSRALPSPIDPNVPADANLNWMLALFNDGSEQDTEVIIDLENDGNNPPYPFEGDLAGNPDTMYPGGETNLPSLQVHSRELMTGTTVGNQTYLNGGTFPCGLLRIDILNYDGAYLMAPELTIDLVPGTHRGYLCESMTEM